MIEYDNCMFLNIFVAIFNKIYNDIMWYKRIYRILRLYSEKV